MLLLWKIRSRFACVRIHTIPGAGGPELPSSIGCGGGGGGGGGGPTGSGGGGGGGGVYGDDCVSSWRGGSAGAGSSGITSGNSGTFDPGTDGAIEGPRSALE